MSKKGKEAAALAKGEEMLISRVQPALRHLLQVLCLLEWLSVSGTRSGRGRGVAMPELQAYGLGTEEAAPRALGGRRMRQRTGETVPTASPLLERTAGPLSQQKQTLQVLARRLGIGRG